MDRKRLGVQFLWSLLLALLVYIGLIVYGDWRQLSALLADFPWRWLPPTLGLTLVNFGVRLLKWHWYLRLIRTPISFGQSARIYGISFLMMMTPGKVGEFVRAFMVRNVSGAPFSVVAPVVLAERMTDGLAMILLAGLGLLAIDDGRIRMAAMTALLVIAVIIIAIQVRPLALWCLTLGHRLPLVNRVADKLAEFYESSYFLLRPKYLIASVLIGVVSWASQGVGFYLILLGFGVEASVSSMLTAVSAFNMSTVVGAVVATPGGLGGVESSLAALSIQLLDLSRPAAAAAALVIRFATLWFGVAIGLVSLALWPHLLTFQKGMAVEEQEARA
ncbi:MAG: lysylphosphatidylglycerol synthase transmembrane domain-containing protein [Caldilineaceae bacterium]|nr:lysylphosphatidylglycerol synthase transmembrane domain-containing protein [Caldilineaceae bacterium]